MAQFNVLSSLVVAEDKASSPATATLSAAAAVGAVALSVASGGASFTSGKAFRVGTGATAETVVAGAGATATNIPLSTPLRKAHRVGEAVVEQDPQRYGPTAAQIATSSSGRESSDIFVGESKFPAGVRRGYESHKATVNLLAVTAPNIALALGLPRSKVTGAGTVASPHQVGTNGTDIGTLRDAALFLSGVLDDGTVFREEYHGVTVDPTGLRIGIARGVDQVIPVKVLAGSVRAQATNAAPIAGGATVLSTADEVIDSLSEAGYFRVKSGGVSTTVNGAKAAGGVSLTLAAAGSLGAGSWIRVGAGSSAQILWNNATATNTLTLRTALYADVADGASVVELELVPFLDLADTGHAITTAGSVREDRQADQAQSTRYIVDQITVGVELAWKDVSLANFARAYGIADPGAATSQTITDMGTTPLVGLYGRGLTASGKTVWLAAGNVYADVASVEYVFQSTGEKPPVPFRGKASSLLIAIHS